MTKESFDLDAVQKPVIMNRAAPPQGKPFLPFEAGQGQSVPYFLPIGGDTLVRQTSSTHGPDGYITTNSEQIARNQARLREKLVSAVDRFSYHEFFPGEGEGTLIITFGVTARAAKDVFTRSKAAKKSVSLLVLKTLWPVPEALIREKARGAKRVLVLEMNDGQYVREIRRVLSGTLVNFFGQMNGKLITPHQIEEVVSHA
jgi:2-oxoglutarate ferredoxin oxidoreductase subunit alpha